MENTNPQENIVDTEIISTENHSTKYGSQLTVVEKDFATLFEGSDMKKHLSSLKRKYSALKVKDVNDTETYEEIKKAISVVRPLRTAMDKKRKEVNKEAKSFIDSVNDMGAKIQAEIAKIEDPLWVEREKFEALQKEEAERIEKEAKERLDARVSELKENGLQFDGSGAYVINDINVSIQFISELPTEEYQKFLSKVREQNEKNIAEQKRKEEEAEAERKKQEAIAEQNKKDKEELEAGRLELRSGQLELLGLGITPEYELLMKTASNDAWKSRYEELKAYKVKLNRIAELQPYIVYIRDYNAMIALDEEMYQKELSGIKQAKIDQEEYDREEAQKELDRQDAEIKEKEAKAKQDRETLATNAKKYEAIGFSYDFRQHRWFVQVGDYSTNISEETMLNEKEGEFEVIKSLIESWQKEKEENEARTAMAQLEEQNRKIKEQEEQRKSLLDDTQRFNEYINTVSMIEIPQVNDMQLSEVLQKIKNLLITK